MNAISLNHDFPKFLMHTAQHSTFTTHQLLLISKTPPILQKAFLGQHFSETYELQKSKSGRQIRIEKLQRKHEGHWDLGSELASSTYHYVAYFNYNVPLTKFPFEAGGGQVLTIVRNSLANWASHLTLTAHDEHLRPLLQGFLHHIS